MHSLDSVLNAYYMPSYNQSESRHAVIRGDVGYALLEFRVHQRRQAIIQQL